jgi:hypothetical protein
MDEKYFFRTRIYFTATVSIAVWLLLVWDHYHGGVPSHHILARKDLPAISNWWGGLLLPLLTWFLLYRIQKRLMRNNIEKSNVPKLPVNIFYGFIGALFFGIVLSGFFTFGYTDIPGYMLIGLFVLALFVPVYRAECLLGFVIGMTFTFGAVLPTGVGSILVLIGALLFLYVRKGIVYVVSRFVHKVFNATSTKQKPRNMKTVFLFLSTGLLTYSLQAQQTIETSYWKYTIGLNSKLKKQSSYIEKYDKDNLLVEKVTYFYSDSLYDRTVYVYNNKKQKIAEEDYIRTHKLIRKKNYEYNDSSLLQLMYWKGRNKIGDSITWREHYYYNAEGRLIKMVETSDGYYPSETHLYQYENKDDGKMVTELVSTEGRKRVQKKFTTYNNKGLITKVTHKGAAPMLDYMSDFIYEYEYDGEGNRIKQKVLERISKTSPWLWTGEYRKKKL